MNERGQSSGPVCTVLRRADQVVMPWRNGGGSTREVAVEPPSALPQAGFRWRVSIATLAADGPFSRFPGVDRRLWLLRGQGVELDVDGRQVVLDRPWQRLDFAGEVPIHARLLGGPTEDLNVMTERAAVVCTAAIHHVDPQAQWRAWLPVGQHLLLQLGGEAVLACVPDRLREGDAVRVDGGGDFALAAGAAPCTLLCATFQPVG